MWSCAAHVIKPRNYEGMNHGTPPSVQPPCAALRRTAPNLTGAGRSREHIETVEPLLVSPTNRSVSQNFGPAARDWVPSILSGMRASGAMLTVRVNLPTEHENICAGSGHSARHLTVLVMFSKMYCSLSVRSVGLVTYIAPA